MIRLDSTVRSLEVILAGAVTTNQLPVTASWADSSSAGYLGGANVTNTNSGTAVTAAAAPTSSGVVRDIDFLNIYNADTVSATATVRINDNGTFYIQCKVALAVGDTLKYTHAKSWEVLNSSGQTKTGSGISSIGASTDNALVRWDGTGGTNIQNSGWTLDDSNVLTAGSHIALGANSISRAGTAAGFSLDASNNATLSASLVTTNRLTIGGAGSIASGAVIKLDNANTGGAADQMAMYENGTDTWHVRTSAGVFGLYNISGGADKFTLNSSGNGVFSGTLTVSGTGPHAIGGATSADVQLYLRGSFSGGTNAFGLYQTSALSPGVGGDGLGLYLNPTINEAGSGTHGLFATLYATAPVIGAGAADLTNAATIYINAAPTGATNNYALWVDAGSVRIDGTDGAGAAAGTLLTAPSAGDPDKWIPINSDGTQYWVPAWAA